MTSAPAPAARHSSEGDGHVTPAAWGRLAWVVLLLGVAAGAGGLVVGTSWGLALGAWLLLTAVLAARLRTPVAGASGVLLLLAPVVVGLRVGPVLDVPPSVPAGALWLVVLLGAGAVLVATRHRRARPSAPALRRGAWACVPALVGVLAAAAVLTVPGAAVRAWAIRRDSATNVLFMRFIAQDGGVDPGVHPNPAYLFQGIAALESVPDAAASELYTAYQIGWAVCITASAVVLACVPLAFVRPAGRAVLSALVVTALVYSWLVTGFAMSFGFANVSLTLVVLGCCLLVSAGQRGSVPLRVGVLAVGTVLAAATWAPLAAVPVVLGVRVLTSVPLRTLVSRRELRRGGTVFLAAALVSAAAYALAVVPRDVRSDGGNLLQDGWFFPWAWWVPVTLAVGLSACVVLARRRRASDDDARLLLRDGAVLGTTVAVVVLAFVGSALASELRPWTYYPKKMSWVASILVVVVLVTVVAGARRPSRAVAPAVALLAFAAVVVPQPDGPGLRGYAPLAGIVAGGPAGLESRSVQILAWLDDPRPHLVWLEGSTADDDLSNLWLTTFIADGAEDPLRSYTSTLEHDPTQVCDALRRAGDDPVLVTRAANAGPAVAATCPDLDFTVEVPDGG